MHIVQKVGKRWGVFEIRQRFILDTKPEADQIQKVLDSGTKAVVSAITKAPLNGRKKVTGRKKSFGNTGTGKRGPGRPPGTKNKGKGTGTAPQFQPQAGTAEIENVEREMSIDPETVRQIVNA